MMYAGERVKKEILTISNEEYHARPEIGSSLIKTIALKSLAHAIVEREETEALLFGQALHSYFLEGESFYSQFAITPQCDRRTKAGKELYETFTEKNIGKKFISERDYETIKRMTQSLVEHPIASKIFSGGSSEKSYFYGNTKCRPDYVGKDYLADLKSTTDASVSAFTHQSKKLGYHIQAEWYLEVYQAVTEIKINDFYFVAVEKTAPYAVNVFKMGMGELLLAAQQIKKALQIYTDFTNQKSVDEKTIIPAYPNQINEIVYSDYYLHEQEEKINE